jgi:hypothetical protein
VTCPREHHNRFPLGKALDNLLCMSGIVHSLLLNLEYDSNLSQIH